MNQIAIRHIIRSLALLPVLFAVLVLASCSMMTDDEPDGPGNAAGSNPDYSISIRISAGAQPGGTRSVLPEEFGTNIENTIDLSDLKILVFDESRVLKDIWFEDGSAPGNVKLEPIGLGDYLISSKLDGHDYSLASRFSVVALANWRSLEESTPIDLKIGLTKYEELADRAFLVNNGNSGEAWVPTEESLIPMFGVLYTTLAGYSTSIYNEGNPMDLGTINVLRSVAKIEIVDLASNDKVEITSIELNRRNCRGFLTPRIFDYKNTHQVTSANIPGSGGTGVAMSPIPTSTPLRFHKKGNVYEVYVPEMELNETIESRMCIDVNIVYNNYRETRKIVFAPYNSEGQPVIPSGGWPDEWKALLRNHIYRFTISSITADPYILLTVDVQPFSCVNLLPQLGLERTDDGYIVVRDRDGNIIKYIRPNGVVLTFEEDNRWPYLGTFMGVFDGTKRVLIGYFADGRSIIFNYNSDEYDPENVTEHLESWEIYSKPTLKYDDGKTIPEHLEETFCFKDYANDGTTEGTIRKAYTHTVLDDKGRVIEEYLYPSLEDFWSHYNTKEPHEVCERIKLADYTGIRYGDKVVTYYDESGNVTCTLTVQGNKETYE